MSLPCHIMSTEMTKRNDKNLVSFYFPPKVFVFEWASTVRLNKPTPAAQLQYVNQKLSWPHVQTMAMPQSLQSTEDAIIIHKTFTEPYPTNRDRWNLPQDQKVKMLSKSWIVQIVFKWKCCRNRSWTIHSARDLKDIRSLSNLSFSKLGN